ncbi:MAG: orotidine-5'-phosphate decarboxylase [Chitinophagaceae bacterium]|nr:orotidine-5'-phosphate decarboxylase [Chitinophagaceae bacterium]MDP1765092.1 orotidine-5'-phosphate decarboxylase [Sediminibacterium sp.]MDP1810300.1 orotidine-5'-phosphate decarboxylase [Sediminibacterium sp.]MDP3128791.1 orotidine-5'-phosphate decarboxylase [Sediminibacterium sp.]
MTRKQLIQLIKEKKSYLCIGLDTDVSKLPKHLQSHPDAIFEFNKAIIDATKDYCVGYKINTAFYESQGLKGWEAMEKTVQYIPDTHFKIADAKRGDIGNTSSQYAKAFFEVMPFDAVTVAPYMGEDSVRPFLEYKDKWTIVLGLTSNAGSDDFQQLSFAHGITEKRLYETVLEKVATWGTTSNLMFVIGATRACDFVHIRSFVPDHFLLVPGIGAQGGSLKDVSKFGLTKDYGLLVNASRAIIFAGGGEDFAEKAKFAAAGYQSEMATYF